MRAYVELLRPPNVVTAVADVLAGYAVAGLGNRAALPWLLAATAGLYAGGVVLNDVFDRHTDARERPERPIPSGRVGARNAAVLGVVLLAAGIACASRATATAAALAGAIAVLVVTYDAWAKRHAMVGPVNMGLCRGLNLVLGMAAVPASIAGHWPLALITVTYIVAVTALSRGEVLGGGRAVAAFALWCLAGVLGALVVVALQPAHRPAAALLLVAALGWRVLPAFWRAYRDTGPGAIRNAVRTGVLSLVLVDAVIGAAYAGAPYAAAILITAVVAGLLARWFPVT